MGTAEVSKPVDLWQVMVGPTGCLMTREELLSALAREDVHRSTLVRRPGSVRWTTVRQALGLPRQEQDRSLDAELPNLPPPIEVRTRKRSETNPQKRSWRPTLGTILGLGLLAFVSGAVLATSTASLTRSFDKPGQPPPQPVPVFPPTSVATVASVASAAPFALPTSADAAAAPAASASAPPPDPI